MMMIIIMVDDDDNDDDDDAHHHHHHQVVQEYERAVIFRLGRLLEGGAKGPGADRDHALPPETNSRFQRSGARKSRFQKTAARN